MQQQIADIYRRDSRRVYATLVRLLGDFDFDFAEDVLQEAFMAAMRQWPAEGLPANPRAWLVSVAKFKAIDRLRRRSRHDALCKDLAHLLDEADEPAEKTDIEDDRLRLIFTCCHPALAPEVQVALTLREVCGLSTEEIASAFLLPVPTLAQRLVRGKAKIRAAGIPYEVPARQDLPARLDSVLTVVYLVFNEGYHASAGDTLLRRELSEEAIRLSRLLREFLPDVEVLGLLALMLLVEARRQARLDDAGDLVLLEDQDRALWDRCLIDEGRTLIEAALGTGPAGSFCLQAAIAALHAEAADAASTDWRQIVALYDLLLGITGSPVVELNRAVAVAMEQGPAAGLALVEALLARGELRQYHLAHAARADLCRRLGRLDEARAAYAQALALSRQEPEQRFLRRRLDALAITAH